jgi:CDP-diacylglycerol--glycerol-3-phosphate 3-phosphatidyltransferase
MSLSHWLTISRIVVAPLFFVVYAYPDVLGISVGAIPFLLIGLLAASEISDFLDGLIARRRNQVSELGKVLDPIADSIFRLSVFLAFTQGPIALPMLLVLCFFYRDSIISMLRTLCALKGIALGARVSGKIKAIVQGATALFILVLLIPYGAGEISREQLQNWSFYAALIAVIYTVGSGFEYIYANRSFIRKVL